MIWNLNSKTNNYSCQLLTGLDDVDVDADADVKRAAGVLTAVNSILREESSQSLNDFVQHSVMPRRRQQQLHGLHVRQQH